MSSLRILFHFFFIVTSIAYDVGRTHNYQYETTVLVDEHCEFPKEQNPVGHRLSANVHVTSIWQDKEDPQQKLLKIQVSDAKLLVPKKSSFEERKTELQNVPKYVSYFLLKDNQVEKFWDDPDENIAVRNLKRSVSSLLQGRQKNGHEKELNVAGRCEVFYKVEGNTVRRGRSSCLHPLQETVVSQPSGVRSMFAQQSTAIDCDLQDATSSIVTRCLASEQVKTYSNLWKKPSICIQSTTLFVLKGTSESKEVFKSNDYNSIIKELKKSSGQLVEGNVFAVFLKEDQPTAINVVDATKSFQKSIDTSNLAKVKSVSAFFKLMPAYQVAVKEDILKVLKNKKFSRVLPQILDLLAASCTSSSLEAVLGFFESEDYSANLERYLISLAVTPRPDASILQGIKSFLEKGNHHEKIEATLVTTLGALIRSYTGNENKVDTKVVDEVLAYIEGALNKCESDACIISYLRGLRNAAQPKSIPFLVGYALKGGKPALEAMLALRNIPRQQLSHETQDQLLNVFHQVGGKQDRSTRAIAAEILLKTNTDENVLRSILESFSDQSDVEFSTFVVSKTLHLMEENKELRSKILRILPEKQIAHYYSLSQKGKSSLFKRQLIGTDGLNVTYGIEMELLEGGLLKRSLFDVEFQSENEVSNLLSVGMFAEGLGSIAGGTSSDDGEETATASAGMELTFLGASLRPYTFFTGTSELFSHAWSGTASEPTPALQGIFSLTDDRRVIILHNGMTVRLELRGAMSADLSASIQISIMWRSAQSQVKNAAALLVRGSAVVDAGVVRSRGEYLFHGQSAIDFSSDLSFSDSPFKMCFQMEHPDLQISYDFQNSVEVTKTKYSIKKTKKRKRFIPSHSFALNQINNELCRMMKSDSY